MRFAVTFIIVSVCCPDFFVRSVYPSKQKTDSLSVASSVSSLCPQTYENKRANQEKKRRSSFPPAQSEPKSAVQSQHRLRLQAEPSLACLEDIRSEKRILQDKVMILLHTHSVDFFKVEAELA